MYNMYCFVHNIKNSRRNDHFFPAKVSPKSQKSSKKAYFVKICCPKGAGGLWEMKAEMKSEIGKWNFRLGKSEIRFRFPEI